MKKKYLIFLVLFILGCPNMSMDVQEAIFRLGYRAGQLETMEYYVKHKSFPNAKDLDPHKAWMKYKP